MSIICGCGFDPKEPKTTGLCDGRCNGLAERAGVQRVYARCMFCGMIPAYGEPHAKECSMGALEARLRAVEEERDRERQYHHDVVEGLHGWRQLLTAARADVQRLAAEREEPVFKAALDIARRWREDGTENAVADILAERDRLTAEVARLRTRSALQAADYTALETRVRALVGALKDHEECCGWDHGDRANWVTTALAPTPRQEGE